MRTEHERLIDHLRNAEVIAESLSYPDVAAQARAARKQAQHDWDNKQHVAHNRRAFSAGYSEAAAARIRSQTDRHEGLPSGGFGSIKDSSR